MREVGMDNVTGERIKDLPAAERPREKMARLGAESLDTAELIAIFLRTGMKGRSALQIARDLLLRHGTLASLAHLSVRALANEPGLGLAKASQLVAALELGRRVSRDAVADATLDSPDAIHRHFALQLTHLSHERLIIALTDTRLRCLSTHTLSVGTLNQTSAHPREVMRPVLHGNAYGFILIHNHPSGDPSPSKADELFTKNILDAAELMQICFVDHVIIGRPALGRLPWFSFRSAGKLSSPRNELP